MAARKKYLVMKCITEGKIADPIDLFISLANKDRGLVGMMPVFSNKRAAVKESKHGKYPIKEVTLSNE